jgi:hypothetical protein
MNHFMMSNYLLYPSPYLLQTAKTVAWHVARFLHLLQEKPRGVKGTRWKDFAGGVAEGLRRMEVIY